MVNSDDIQANSTEPEKKEKKGKKAKKDKKTKKDKSKMTPFELKIEEQKEEMRRIYDCLMYQQCLIQYNKYGNYMQF